MKRTLLILAEAVFLVLFFFSLSVAQCPEDTVDTGECDTLHLEIYPEDQEPPGGPPFFVRFPIYVTHDVLDPVDSICGMDIPLCYEHSNPGRYCSLSIYWNNINLYPQADLDRSVFRHFIEGEDTLIHNWMMDLSQQGMGQEWDCRVLDVDDTSHFWFSLIPCGVKDQRFGEGSRVLLATMTFKLEDTMTICVDTCFWPPASRFAFARSDGKTYVPRHFLPVCEYVGWPVGPPPQLWCPPDQQHHTNGHSSNLWFQGESMAYIIQSVDLDFVGDGLENVQFAWLGGLGTPEIEGEVEYDITDHCQAGGYIRIGAQDSYGRWGYCTFDVELSNNPPSLNLQDSWFALADYTMVLQVSADDPDNDSVMAIELDALWYEPDSLQPPTNPPFFDGGNPGVFTWEPTEADTGAWVCSFLATDVCGAVDTHWVTILVGTMFCGDCTGDEFIELGDLVCLISFLFGQGPPPDPVCKCDVNCNGVVDIGDLVYMINYLYRFGPAPCFDCCAGVSGKTFTKPNSPN